MEHPVVGGYTPEKVALRRAISLGFDATDFIKQVYRGNAVPAQSPIVPGTFGYDPLWRTGMSEYSPAKAKALLDTYGYVDRNGDGWREQPDGSALVIEKASATSEIERRVCEQWRRYMTAIGIKMEFRFAQWPELVKQSLAGTLMMWNFAWQATEPDSDLFFALSYGPNKASANDARFELKAYDTLYERQRVLPDGPERLTAMHEATRLLVAYMPYKFHLHRIQLDLAQPWLIGYRRHPFTTRAWAYLDVDNDAQERPRPDMLGRILRISSLLTIALATVLTVWFVDLGLSPWLAIAIGLLLPFAIHALPLGVEFITGALIDRRPISRLGPVDAVRLWLVESWRSFVVFNIDQPWRANFAERPIVSDPARPAVLLVHGYMCNRASWRRWVLEGLPTDWNVATISLEPVYAPVEEYAESLQHRHSEVARKQWCRACHAGLPQHGRPRCTRLFACEGARCSRARHHDRHSASRHGLRPFCARQKLAPDAAGMRLRATAGRGRGSRSSSFASRVSTTTWSCRAIRKCLPAPRRFGLRRSGTWR